MIDMAECAQFRQSVEVDVPPSVANEEWTRFVFYSLYYGNRLDAEPDDGFVRLEGIGDVRTRVTVDLNFCSDWQDIEDKGEIARIEKDLGVKLARYKRFVEQRQAA
ncbi:MAG: hypothetical protein EHM52_04545 [Actinomycetota bacterium]|nr:MAG: hypothetical protein EHM52_04545 [Actinomycetota bacterium]